MSGLNVSSQPDRFNRQSTGGYDASYYWLGTEAKFPKRPAATADLSVVSFTFSVPRHGACYSRSCASIQAQLVAYLALVSLRRCLDTGGTEATRLLRAAGLGTQVRRALFSPWLPSNGLIRRAGIHIRKRSKCALRFVQNREPIRTIFARSDSSQLTPLQ